MKTINEICADYDIKVTNLSIYIGMARSSLAKRAKRGWLASYTPGKLIMKNPVTGAHHFYDVHLDSDPI